MTNDLEGRSAPDAYGVDGWAVEQYGRPMTPLDTERQRFAATMGAILRRALRQHIEECRCGYRIALDRCPEGWRLWCLQPEGDQIALA